MATVLQAKKAGWYNIWANNTGSPILQLPDVSQRELPRSIANGGGMIVMRIGVWGGGGGCSAE
jgi:hypothetical protein